MIQILADDFDIHPYFTVLKTHDYERYGHRARFVKAEVNAYLAFPFYILPLEAEAGPSSASYVVEQSFDPEELSDELDDHETERFKQVIKALGLDAPHSIKRVEHHNFGGFYDIGKANQEEPEKGSGKEAAREERDEGKVEEVMEDEDAEKYPWLGPYSYGGRKMKPYPRYKTQCLDCGADVCQGSLKASEPQLMMLGSGELKAYSIK